MVMKSLAQGVAKVVGSKFGNKVHTGPKPFGAVANAPYQPILIDEYGHAFVHGRPAYAQPQVQSGPFTVFAQAGQISLDMTGKFWAYSLGQPTAGPAFALVGGNPPAGGLSTPVVIAQAGT